MLQKIKNFCLKYKLVIAMAITSVLIFLNLIDESLEWLSIALIILMAFSMNVQEAFCYSLFLSAFSRVGLNFIVGMVACAVSVLGRYIFDLVKKRKTAYIRPLVMTLALLLMYIFTDTKFTSSGIVMGLMIIYILGFVYLFFVYSKEVNVSRCFNAVLTGFIVAAALGGLSYICGLKIELFEFDGEINRLQLLSYKINNITVHVSVQIAYAIYSIFKDDKYVSPIKCKC